MESCHQEDSKPLAPASSSRPGPSHSAIALSEEEKKYLLHVARQTLQTYLASGEMPRYAADSPALCQLRAVFVTLWRRGTDELRGCRGESMARRSLVEAVSAMAVASAVDDPRFRSVTLHEVPDLRIDINALTPLVPILPEEVEVGRHGLMVVRGLRAGLLLPDVPVRFGWDRVAFLEGVCQKAGLPPRVWQEPDVRLLGFESEEWGEEEE